MKKINLILGSNQINIKKNVKGILNDDIIHLLAQKKLPQTFYKYDFDKSIKLTFTLIHSI